MLTISLAMMHEDAAGQSDLLEDALSRIAAGDSDALISLYAHTHAAVYGFALSLLRSVHDAEDVEQETYLRIFSSAARYRAEGKPMAWILTITKRLAVSKLRERTKQPLIAEDSFLHTLCAIPTLDEADRITLRDLLLLLSPEEQQVVLLHALSGLRHREIAELLGSPLTTVLSRYSRAIKKLKTQWKETERHD